MRLPIITILVKYDDHETLVPNAKRDELVRMLYTYSRSVTFMVTNTEYLDPLQQPLRSAFCSLRAQNFIPHFLDLYWRASRNDNNVNRKTTRLAKITTIHFRIDKQDISRENPRDVSLCLCEQSLRFVSCKAFYSTLHVHLLIDQMIYMIY